MTISGLLEAIVKLPAWVALVPFGVWGVVYALRRFDDGRPPPGPIQLPNTLLWKAARVAVLVPTAVVVLAGLVLMLAGF